MEVLISIGILAVGLSAVVALIPAGGSEAQRALSEDRKASVGLAALEEAVTRGILSPDRWSPAQPSNPPYEVLIDPIGGAPFAGLNLVTLDSLGVTALTADEVFRSQDDPVYTLENSGEDGPAEPLYFSNDAKRLSEGNYSWLATVAPVPASNGQDHVLTVVTFNKRAGSASSYALTFAAGNTVRFAWSGSLGALQNTFPRGGAVLLSDNSTVWDWRRIIFVTLASGSAELMVASNTGVSAGDNLFAFEGAIGVAERIVRLEGDSPWSQ